MCVSLCVYYPPRWTPCVMQYWLCLQTDSTAAFSSRPPQHTLDLQTQTHITVSQYHTHTRTHTHTDHCGCQCGDKASGQLCVGSWSSWRHPAEREPCEQSHGRAAFRCGLGALTPPYRRRQWSPPGGGTKLRYSADFIHECSTSTIFDSCLPCKHQSCQWWRQNTCRGHSVTSQPAQYTWNMAHHVSAAAMTHHTNRWTCLLTLSEKE